MLSIGTSLCPTGSIEPGTDIIIALVSTLVGKSIHFRRSLSLVETLTLKASIG